MIDIPYELEEIRSKVSDGVDGPTDNQIRFAYHYYQTKNGMKSVRDSGYTHSTPGSQSSAAYRLLSTEKIQILLKGFRDGEFEDCKS